MSGLSPHENASVLQFGVPLGMAPRAAILLHGRGGSAEDIAGLRGSLPLDRHSILAPQAANGTWYPNSFLAPLQSNEPWLCSALTLVESLVSRCTTHGVPAANVVLIGYSQGACLASEFLASYPQRYGALIAFTGGLPGPLETDLTHAGRLDGTPVLLTSGDPDPHVPWNRVEETASQFRSMGARVDLRCWPGRAHTISAEELAIAANFIQSIENRHRVDA